MLIITLLKDNLFLFLFFIFLQFIAFKCCFDLKLKLQGHDFGQTIFFDFIVYNASVRHFKKANKI